MLQLNSFALRAHSFHSLKEIREPSFFSSMKKIINLKRLNNSKKIDINEKKMGELTPKRMFQKARLPEEIIPELARIHAHLCGDGSVFIFKIKAKDRNFRAGIAYSNNNQRLLDDFRKDFTKLFGVKMKMNEKVDVSVKSIKIFQELTGRFGDFGSRKWRVHNSIKNANATMKLEWLKAFFEDEAYDEKRYNRLRIKSMNLIGLRDAKEMLDSLGIFSSITGPNCDLSYYLTIPQWGSVELFNEFVKEPARK